MEARAAVQEAGRRHTARGGVPVDRVRRYPRDCDAGSDGGGVGDKTHERSSKMRAFRAAVLSVLLVVAGALPAYGAAASAPAAGTFLAEVDFTTVHLKDVPPGRCLLTVSGKLTFAGSLVGDAEGTTNALETAPCSEVAGNPAGTFFDVFQFRGHFIGYVNGRHVDTTLTYTGVTHVGGPIDAVIALRGSGVGPLHASAIVAEGGTYTD